MLRHLLWKVKKVFKSNQGFRINRPWRSGFPAHVKLNPPKDLAIDTLIINGAECEPYITSDYRVCMENTENIIEGIDYVLQWTGIPRALIGIEDNKPEAIKKLKSAVKNKEHFCT